MTAAEQASRDCNKDTINSLCEKLSKATKRIELLEDAVYTAIPYVEDCDHDKAYKPGAIAKIVRQLKTAVGEK